MLAILGLWAVISVAGLPPLHDPVTPEQVQLPLAILAALGVVLYGYASFSYFRVWLRRRTPLAFAVAFAFALLAEALIIVDPLAADELAPELVGVARADGDQLLRDRRRRVVGVVRGALQRPLPRRDAAPAGAR